MTETQSRSPATERLSRQRRYRRLFVGLIVGGVALALVLREALGYPLVGEAVYWVAIVAALGVWLGTSVSLFDERDAALERRASQATMYVLAVVLVLGASAARVLPRVTDITVPAYVGHALYAYISVFVVFALSYGWLRLRGH